MDPKFEFLVRLRAFALVAASGALLVALQMSGLSLAKLMGDRKALLVSAIMLGLGAATHLYVVYVLPLWMNH
jgi:hypothetical protein